MKISLSQPDITEKERKAVLGVLRTPHLALGPKLAEFEEKFARYVGTKYAVVVSSGTAGLHLLVRALGIGKGDEVITTPFSFVASANCALYEGAKPVFVDIEPNTLNIDPDKIEKAITKRTKAMVVVDIFGHPADWGPILKIAKKYKLKVIEDSCEALGAEYKMGLLRRPDKVGTPRNDNKKWVKCGNFGDAAVFAFYPNKQITTLGEGGMIVTNNKRVAELCQSMHNQGRRVKNGKWLEHVRLGYNYRMTDTQAAMGIAQLARIKEILRKRAKVAEIYNKELVKLNLEIILGEGMIGEKGGRKGMVREEIKGNKRGWGGFPIKLPYVAPWAKISWFVYVIQLNPGTVPIRGQSPSLQKCRDQILKKLQRAGIQCSNYFQCIHLQPFYRKMFGYKRGDFPVAEAVSDRTIALPFYNNLKEKQIDYIVKTLKKCL